MDRQCDRPYTQEIVDKLQETLNVAGIGVQSIEYRVETMSETAVIRLLRGQKVEVDVTDCDTLEMIERIVRMIDLRRKD